ncbi:olfactory receptor 11G2-like [Hemicordylus capensis]|uniref:olfactory receptor 11G2-like n=1 Tax=Hemicordylus capensis TaxID=884348 RepID=UPI0023034E01|nr:olfactory receptor 11G2-like [Hemicordylus capensis]
MELVNGTTVQEFILLGFRVGQQGRLLLLIFFIAVYTLTLAENFIITMLVVQDAHLARLPMYILLGNFSWLEMCYVSATVPRMLFDLSFEWGAISFHACFLQFYVFFSLGNTECFFLSAMALDRYLAICHPLRYPQIMSQDSCYALVTACWVLGFLWYIAPVFLISRLSFCGPRTIDHFVCDPGPILALVCPPLGYAPFIYYVFVSSVVLATFLFILVSYICIGVTLVKTSSQSRCMKGFSTVSSHLAVVTLFYGSVVAMYVGPNGESHAVVTKVVTLFYSAVTPLLNPLIYCLRNDQVKEALAKLLRRKRMMQGKRRKREQC